MNSVMSSASDFTPLPVPRARSSVQTLPQVRRLMTVEWSKLFAEATEKDTKEGADFKIVDGDCNDCEYEEDESDCEEENENIEYNEYNEYNEPNEPNSEMPWNLCYKSKTVPNMCSRFETSDNTLELSIEKKSAGNHCKTSESAKQISCTVPNFQSNNYQDFMLTSKNTCDNNKSVFKQSQYNKDDNENTGSNKDVNNGINLCSKNYYNRTPMKEVNNFESQRKKNSLGNDQILNNVDKPVKTPVIKSLHNCGVNESPKIEENNRESKCEEYNEGFHSEDLQDGDNAKQKSGQNLQTKGHVRFAVPAVPSKVKNTAKAIVVNGKSYQVLAPLGKGGSSCVYLVLNSKNELLAVKCVKLAGVNESVKNDYLNEIQHLMRMQHSKHVIRLFDHQYVAAQKLLYAVMEKGDTDLSRFLKDKASSEEGITPELIMYYWNEMLLAVKSIHDNNIIHRDLKPANFLLVSGRLKLIDFGIASSIQNEQTSILMDTQSGTFNYMSPEALLDLGSGNEVVLKIGRKSDVWSLGCILYYFLYKKTPYQDLVKPLHKMRAITDPNYPVKFPKLPGVPDILIESCKRCLVHDRKKRASIEELLELKNKPLLTLSQVLTRLRHSLTEGEYLKAEKALLKEIDES